MASPGDEERPPRSIQAVFDALPEIGVGYELKGRFEREEPNLERLWTKARRAAATAACEQCVDDTALDRLEDAAEHEAGDLDPRLLPRFPDRRGLERFAELRLTARHLPAAQR